MNSGFGEPPATRATAWPRVITKLVQWRNWRLGVKLAAVVLVPVTFALTLGVLQIGGQIRQAEEYARLDGVIAAASAVRSAATQLQEERTRAAELLGHGAISATALRGRFAVTDDALDASGAMLDGESPIVRPVKAARSELDGQLATLPGLRRQVLSTNVEPGIAIDSYNTIVASMLALERALIDEISSTQLGSIAASLHELARVAEEMHLQQAWVLVGLLRSEFSEKSVAELEASETRRNSSAEEFRAAATPQQRIEYDRLYLEPAFPSREDSVRLAMASRSSDRSEALAPLLAVPSHIWEGQSRSALSSLQALQIGMETQLHRTAFTLQDDASNLAGLSSVILLSAMLVAGVIVVLVARQLLGSLDALRHSALDTANFQLPRTVAELRAGNGARAPIKRVPVDTSEEVGQVARAFDDVQEQAINLAAEQATLRKSYSDSFVNVSRRSQSLLERQLRLFEQLERDEEDPDQLATLFQLDHLATRMRRNNENLMVLSGTDLARCFTQPASPGDLVRAAVSEIEHYPRVLVKLMPSVRIVGYAANDMVRLLAELLDNAANCSSPKTTVTVSGHRRGDGSVAIDIVDRGIGMDEAELAAANERVTTDGELELTTSRRMGLFVVGRLASRHGIDVRLHRGPDDVGVRATVSLRADLVVEATPLSGHLNGIARSLTIAAPPQPRQSLEDTLAEKIDWDALDAEPIDPPTPTRNGYHLLDPSRSSSPHPEVQQPYQRSTPTRNYTSPAHSLGNGHNPHASNGHSHPQPRSEADTDRETAPTPIFDTLASAWFQTTPRRASQPEAEELRWPADDSKGTFLSSVEERFPSYQHDTEPTPRHAPPEDQWEQDSRWRFTSDQAQHRAEEVSTAQPTEYTSVGLPLRVPRANLVAGSVKPSGPPPGSGQRRDANVSRQRLTRFQEGVWQGRRRESPGPFAAPNETTQPPTGEQHDWSFHTDTTAQQAEAALSQEPKDFTSAGLPRRTPKAQLAPGTANHQGTDDVSPRRDAGLMRGRLTSFQRGVREGKHSLREPFDKAADEQ